jgi:hypothetical protein
MWTCTFEWISMLRYAHLLCLLFKQDLKDVLFGEHWSPKRVLYATLWVIPAGNQGNNKCNNGISNSGTEAYYCNNVIWDHCYRSLLHQCYGEWNRQVDSLTLRKTLETTVACGLAKHLGGSPVVGQPGVVLLVMNLSGIRGKMWIVVFWVLTPCWLLPWRWRW